MVGWKNLTKYMLCDIVSFVKFFLAQKRHKGGNMSEKELLYLYVRAQIGFATKKYDVRVTDETLKVYDRNGTCHAVIIAYY